MIAQQTGEDGVERCGWLQISAFIQVCRFQRRFCRDLFRDWLLPVFRKTESYFATKSAENLSSRSGRTTLIVSL